MQVQKMLRTGVLAVLAVLLATGSAVASNPTRAALRALRKAKQLTLKELERNPSGYLGQTVAFDCFFAQTGDVYRPFYTPFIREHYVNFWVWRVDARLWEPKEREGAFFFCFVDRKNSEALKAVQSLKLFDPIKIIARVETVSEDKPWLRVDYVYDVDIPSYTQKGIKHIDLGMRQLEKADFDLASRLFEIALQEELPVEARKLVYRQIGLSYFELGQYEAAEEKLLIAEKLIGTPDPVLLMRLGQSKLRVAEKTGDKERLKSAIDYLKKAVSQEPNMAEAHADLGLAYGLLGKYVKGLRSCEVATKLVPQHARALRNMAVIYRLKGDPNESIRLYQKAILKKANEPLFHKELGDVYFSDVAQYTEAETEYRNYVTLVPDKPEPYFLRARARLAQDNVDGAIEDLTAAIEYGADYRDAYPELAKAFIRKKDYDDAERILKKAAERFPQDVEVRLMLADLLQRVGKWEESVAVLDAAVDISPDDQNVRFQQALALADKPEPDRAQAIKILEDILRKEPNKMEARLLAGRLYVETSQPSRALNHLNRYVRENPQDIQALLYQGAAYTQAGSFAKASEVYSEVLKMDATNPFALSNSAYLLCLREETPEKAEEYALKAYEADPKNKLFAGTLSWALSLNGKYREAKSIAVDLVAQEETTDAFYYLALAEFNLGEIDEAQRDVAKALELSKALPKTRDNTAFISKIRALDGNVRRAIDKRRREMEALRRGAARGGRAPRRGAEPAPVVTPMPE